MKAQPITTSTSRARVNTVYPPPNKRAYQPVQTHASHPSQISPRSMGMANAFNSRKTTVQVPTQTQTQRPSMPYRTSSAMYSSSSSSVRRAPPTPPAPAHPRQSAQQLQYEAATLQVAHLAQKRARLAQRQALYARKQEYRWSHVTSLDRGIRLLLEEEYREDVKAWLLEKEKSTLANAAAMDQQPELQWYMRSHLIDFILEIHLHFRLRPETLYLTLSILDRYVSRRIVYKKHYQLVGCVSLWLASKFEDAKERVPSVKDLKELCHDQYDDSSFGQMEFHVLSTVEWDLGVPTPESWLRILCTETHIGGSGFGSGGFQLGVQGLFGGGGSGSGETSEGPFEDMRTQHVARFLMELTLFGREFLAFVPSELALGALCLAREICGKPRRMADESADVLRVISLLDTTLSQALDSVSQVLVKKYSYAYYSKASGIVVSFYLRGNRYPLANAQPAEESEVLATYEVPVEQLRASYLANRAGVVGMEPTTPVRTRKAAWGSAGSMETTPGLVRSDSCSSGMDVDVDTCGEEEDGYGEECEDEGRSVRSFSQPREFGDEDEDDMDDEEEEEAGEEFVDEEEFEMDPATTASSATNVQANYFQQQPHHHHHHHLVHSISSDSQSSDLSVPSSDDLGPITPVTPMFQLDPFGTAQAQQLQQLQHQHQHQIPGVVQQQVVVSSKDKENVGPDGRRGMGVGIGIGRHSAHGSCEDLSLRVQVDGAVGVASGHGDEMGGEYRHALLAIVS